MQPPLSIIGRTGRAPCRRRPVNSALGPAEHPLPNNTSIEPARAEEAAEFIQLRGRTRENAVSEIRLASIGVTATTWAADIRSGLLLGFTAKESGRLVGYCFGNTETGEIVVLALLPEAESQGIGRTLLNQVVAVLRVRGHQRLFLGCSADPNVRSHGFYRRLGWRPTGVLDSHDDEILELNLGANESSASVA